MIKLFKNKEVSRALLIQIIISVIATVYIFTLNTVAGYITLMLSVVLIIIQLISTYSRYKTITRLSENINKILHGDNTIEIENYSEGELGILHSEIYKMTIRLREQQQKLINDKVFLADSIADISHQIRTPLTSINLMVELLSDPDITVEKRMKLIRDLKGMLNRIDWLIVALLKMSKLDAGTVNFNQETLTMKELMDKACSPLLVPIELRGQELSIKAEGTFTGDISWTCEAVGNIVKNCMEHTPEGGKLEITATENPIYSEIIITDSGCGISKDDLPHIFERFYKGDKSNDKSFGIGLALARMIITNQNGTVKAENRKEKGAKFTIRFYKVTV
jgi:signal transduction histidine kinase